jgi:hypothetical protein
MEPTSDEELLKKEPGTGWVGERLGGFEGQSPRVKKRVVIFKEDPRGRGRSL